MTYCNITNSTICAYDAIDNNLDEARKVRKSIENARLEGSVSDFSQSGDTALRYERQAEKLKLKINQFGACSGCERAG